jgi:uncharacterized phage protein (TIGR01671 family)
MREIKFRVWDNVDYMSSPFTLNDILSRKVEFTSDCKVMQFTGLFDKNGNEIYEGDIISFEDDPHGIVKWNNKFSCFTCFEDDKLNDEGEIFDWSQLIARHQKHYVLLGNIHENQNLINP